LEKVTEQHGHSIKKKKKKKIFLQNKLSSVEIFLQWDSRVVSRNSDAAQLNAWKESCLLTDKRSILALKS